jgi:hypothetical protein
LKRQNANKRSHLNIYKELAKLRDKPSFQWGNFKYALITDDLFSFLRKAEGHETFLVAMNMGKKTINVDFSELEFIKNEAKIVYFIASPDDPDDILKKYPIYSTISTSNIELRRRNCLILSF